MTNKEKFLQLVTTDPTDTLQRNTERIKNRAMLRESQNIALKILLRLKELNWTQKQLADRLDVTPQQVSKIVSGKENFTLDTLVKLQSVLQIRFLAETEEQQNVTLAPIFSVQKNEKQRSRISKQNTVACPVGNVLKSSTHH